MKNLIAVYSTILLVDDESEILEFIQEEIAPHFGKILLASDGVEACEVLKHHKVDLIVTDYIMPNMNGIQLINFIKANYPLIPIIMLTSNSANPEVLDALQNGAFDILDKPFRTPVLVNRIQNGLLVPELIKTVWSYISNDLSVPRIEEFLRKPIKEQHQIMYAYSSVGKMKSLIRNEEGGAPRGKIRFKPEKNEICFVSFEHGKFSNEISAIILNESAQGACLVINRKLIPPNITIVIGLALFVKIGNLDPIESIVRWIDSVDSDLIKIGIHHPL
jgi:CheY-like chemotaxis protein